MLAALVDSVGGLGEYYDLRLALAGTPATAYAPTLAAAHLAGARAAYASVEPRVAAAEPRLARRIADRLAALGIAADGAARAADGGSGADPVAIEDAGAAAQAEAVELAGLLAQATFALELPLGTTR